VNIVETFTTSINTGLQSPTKCFCLKKKEVPAGGGLGVAEIAVSLVTAQSSAALLNGKG